MFLSRGSRRIREKVLRKIREKDGDVSERFKIRENPGSRFKIREKELRKIRENEAGSRCARFSKSSFSSSW